MSKTDDYYARLKQEMERNLLHNHSTTNIAFIGWRPVGECSACDYERKRKEVRDGERQ